MADATAPDGADAPSGAEPHIVIVGASLAGVHAAQAIRRDGRPARITIVGDETETPYDRPPLSKQYLGGDWEADKLTLRPAKDPDELGVDWRLGTDAVGLDLDARVVRTLSMTDGADELAFDGLVIATGARARRLPGTESLSDVHVVRTKADADRLRAAVADRDGPIAVIGAGFIGGEVAATFRSQGHDVVMIEAADAPLTRVLDADAGLAVAELHRSHGVDVRLGAAVEGFEIDDHGDHQHVRGVRLADGSVIEARTVVVGIGAIPNTEWLTSSGLEIDNGVRADATCLAAPGVAVAGDVANWDHPRYGRPMRVEQWDNGVDQGGYAGRRLLAELGGEPAPDPFGPVPWFWSDQYDRKIQFAGVSGPGRELVHGDPDEGRFAQLYFDADGAPCGLLAWNRPRHAIKGRQLLASGASVDEIRDALA